MNVRRIFCTAAAFLSLTAPAIAGLPPAQRAALTDYLRAVQARDYATAYGMLSRDGHAYYRNAANYASVFRAFQLELRNFRIESASGSNASARYLVNERLSIGTAARTQKSSEMLRSAYDVTREGSAYRIRDIAHPYKVAAPNVQATANGVRATIHQVAFYPREVAITMTLTNLQGGFATFLPYNRTILVDDRDAVYRSIETKDWRITDKGLFLGVRLAGNAQYTGTMRFSAPANADSKELHLEIAPVLRDEPHAHPFGLTIPGFATTPA